MVVVTDKDSKESHVLDFLTPGELYNETSFLFSSVSNVTIRATSNSLVAVFPRAKVEKLILESVDFGVAFYKFLAQSIFYRGSKLQFYDKPELQEQTTIKPPKLDPNNYLLNRNRLPIKKAPLELRKRLKQSDPSSHASLPAAISPRVIAQEGSSLSVPKLRERAPSFSGIDVTITTSKLDCPGSPLKTSRETRSKSKSPSRKTSRSKSPRTKSAGKKDWITSVARSNTLSPPGSNE